MKSYYTQQMNQSLALILMVIVAQNRNLEVKNVNKDVVTPSCIQLNDAQVLADE